MKRFVVAGLAIVLGIAAAWASEMLRPVHTYSIVAFDSRTGQMGVAVQSHWFSVGSMVTWAESGVGVVATQSFVDPSYGALGLELMRRGKGSKETLKALLAADSHPEVRQVAMIDASGAVAAHTGNKCIPEAGHVQGVCYSCQANLMAKNTVWKAMATAFEKAEGELVDRLMAALEAAEGEGGDIRGRQSAAILVVTVRSSGQPWRDRIYDLRVEDNAAPLVELRRLIVLAKAYNRMNRGDELLAENRIEEAMKEYSTAMAMVPGNAEMIFWPAVTLATLGRKEESLPLFQKVFTIDPNWAVLLPRLPQVGQFPADEDLIKRIMALIPKKKTRK